MNRSNDADKMNRRGKCINHDDGIKPITLSLPGVVPDAISRAFIAANPQKCPTLLIARTGLAYAVACSSFPRRPIALLSAFIMASS
jgi:hypothetical protein